jgi:glycosyltransferase involved in cell wall biosynthesis
MTIGVVLHPYGETAPAGLARTIFEFAKSMIETDPDAEYVIFLKKEPIEPPMFPGTNWRVEVLAGTRRYWLDNLRDATPVDVCLFNTPVLPLFWRPKRSIVLALDFAYLSLGWGTPRDALRTVATYLYHWYSLARADRIVSISQATHRDLLRFFPLSRTKASVVLCGYKRICAVPPESMDLPDSYLLFAGILKPRKNVLRIFEAFAQIAKDVPECALVVAGNPAGPYYERLAGFAREAGLSERIRFAGHLTDAQLSYAYQHARALIFPTLIEGFGFPILEAMDCGTPVVTSNRSSLSEVAGAAAVLVDPYDTASIAGGMREVATDSALRARLAERGRARAAEFSWQKSARELRAIIDAVCA